MNRALIKHKKFSYLKSYLIFNGKTEIYDKNQTESSRYIIFPLSHSAHRHTATHILHRCRWLDGKPNSVDTHFLFCSTFTFLFSYISSGFFLSFYSSSFWITYFHTAQCLYTVYWALWALSTEHQMHNVRFYLSNKFLIREISVLHEEFPPPLNFQTY